MADRVTGHAWNTGPGGATRLECVGYADAINALADAVDVELEEGTDNLEDIVDAMEGVQKAGKARGCTFLSNPS